MDTLPASFTGTQLARRFFSLLVPLLTCIALTPAPAAAQQGSDAAPAEAPSAASGNAEELARQHFTLGRAQYQSGAFLESAKNFERAYEYSKREVLWYNIYLAYRDAGDNREASVALRHYLEGVDKIENRPQLEARLNSLERLVAKEEAREQEQRDREAAATQAGAGAEPAEVAPSEQPAVDAAIEANAEPVEEPSRLPAYILMGAGGALIIGGIVTGAMSSSKLGKLEDSCTNDVCDPELESIKEDGQTLALVADVLMLAGVAAGAVGGTLLFLSLSEQPSASDTAVGASLGCGVDGCNARVRVAF
ncbi:MAG: hypothetical protein OEZ06_17020 [Myxococcales bacterium]|nr:hypothetical protein [Myxococcales bacterium]